MDRRRLLALLFGLALLAPLPAVADDDEDDDDEDDDDDDRDDDDHDDALRAVRTAGALPLEALLVRFRQQVTGRLIDVTLVRRRGGLAYRVTYLAADGRVRRAHFDARSGTLQP